MVVHIRLEMVRGAIIVICILWLLGIREDMSKGLVSDENIMNVIHVNVGEDEFEILYFRLVSRLL